MIAQDAPIFEPGDGVLDARPTSTVATPRGVSNDAATREAWCNELVDASIAAVGENATVVLGQLLDDRAAVVNGVVTVAWSARLGGDHVTERRIRTWALHDHR